MACQGFQFTGTTLTVAKPTLERTISRWEIGASLPDIYLRHPCTLLRKSFDSHLLYTTPPFPLFPHQLPSEG